MKAGHDLIHTDFVQRVNTINTLSEIIKDYLQINSEQHVLWAISNHDTLTLLTDNTLFANQLRYKHHDILEYLQHNHQLNFREFKLKIIPPPKEKTIGIDEKRFNISDKTQRLLNTLADELAHDELANALKRLANTSN